MTSELQSPALCEIPAQFWALCLSGLGWLCLPLLSGASRVGRRQTQLAKCRGSTHLWACVLPEGGRGPQRYQLTSVLLKVCG